MASTVHRVFWRTRTSVRLTAQTTVDPRDPLMHFPFEPHTWQNIPGFLFVEMHMTEWFFLHGLSIFNRVYFAILLLDTNLTGDKIMKRHFGAIWCGRAWNPSGVLRHSTGLTWVMRLHFAMCSVKCYCMGGFHIHLMRFNKLYRISRVWMDYLLKKKNKWNEQDEHCLHYVQLVLTTHILTYKYVLIVTA